MRGALALVMLVACGDNLAGDLCSNWRQWGNNAAHDGATCARGQALERELANLVLDPFVAEEAADAQGVLFVHYQSPLVDGDYVYAMGKGGVFTPVAQQPDPYSRHSQTWIERGLRWEGDTLVEQWTFESDWKPPPELRFEAMFQPALAGDRIAIPGAGGTLFLLDRRTGDPIERINPFPTIDPDTYVAGGIAVAPDGTLYYNTVTLSHDLSFSGADASGSLIQVKPDGSTRVLDYAQLIPDAPPPETPCEATFDPLTTSRPWPPAPNPDGTPVLPPRRSCGTQRPGINSTPAINADGTLFVVTRAHFNGRYSYVAALAPDLSLLWSSSLRDHLDDGCGVTLPADAPDGTDTSTRCRVGATLGVDPETNARPAAIVDDNSSSSPVALPDGGVLYGALTRYNARRGHLLKLSAGGAITASHDFGWDTTPAVFTEGSDYRIVIKDNTYGRDANGVAWGPFLVMHLDSDLNALWRFANTETMNCVRGSDGTIQCVDDHPGGFEWCINAPAVDRDGVTYGNAEDGWVYAINPDGSLRDRFFLERALGAAYTPLAIDGKGRIYAMNNGRLIVVGAR